MKVIKSMRTTRKNRSPNTQLRAIKAITDLILEYPALSAAFSSLNAGKALLEVRPHPERCRNEVRALLQPATRRALVCVQEVEVLSLVCAMDVEDVREREGEDMLAKLICYVG